MKTILILSVYFIPWIIARYRSHGSWMAIGVMNLFLGWTVVGWVWALIWSLTKK